MAMRPGSDDKINCALTTGTHKAITIIAQQPSTISAEVSGMGRLLPGIFFVITHNHLLRSARSPVTVRHCFRRVQRCHAFGNALNLDGNTG